MLQKNRQLKIACLVHLSSRQKEQYAFFNLSDVQLENAALRQKIFHVPFRKKIIMGSEYNTEFTNVLT
jgi:hypothetical protein